MREIHDRKLFLKEGYASLFDMMTRRYRYSPGAAMDRINTMRLASEIPGVEMHLESGELSMSVASQVQSFFQHEAKEERAYSANAKIELIEFCKGKSKREVGRELMNRNPEIERRESIRQTSKDRVRVSISINQELLEKLNQLRDLYSHSNPDMSLEELLEKLTDQALAKPKPRLRPAEVKRTRYVPAHERRKMGERKCQYKNPETGEICGATKFLERDHIHPFSKGGESQTENLQWLCSAHNKWKGNRLTPDQEIDGGLAYR